MLTFRKIGTLATLALLLVMAMLAGCESGKGTETPVEEVHYPTRAACDERGWTKDFGDTYGGILDTCLAMLYHGFIEDSEWDPGYKPYTDDELVSASVEWRGIRKISAKVKDLYYLEQIGIWGSDSLAVLPAEIYAPDSLKRIYVDRALYLKTVSGPKEGGVGKNLEAIFLFRLPRAHVEDAFWTLPIKMLRLDSMSLTEVPAGVLQMKNLKYLELEYNYLTTVPREIYGLDSLEELVIGVNNIAEIPQWACERQDIRWTVGMNKICNSSDSLWSCIGYSEQQMNNSIQYCN